MQQVPKSLLVIGAGAIGVEFAYFYNTFGSSVTVVEMMPTILPVEDKEISDLLAKSFKKTGIQLLTGTKVVSLKAEGDAVSAVLENSKGERSETNAEVALMAVGCPGKHGGTRSGKIGRQSGERIDSG